MKAVIEVSRKGSIFGAAAKQVAAARQGKVPDFHLSFESARSLFAELTPARLDLLDTLRRAGPCSVVSTLLPRRRSATIRTFTPMQRGLKSWVLLSALRTVLSRCRSIPLGFWFLLPRSRSC